MRNREPEQIADLAGRDDHRDASGEADRDRKRNVFDVGARTQQPDGDKKQAGHHGCDRQAIVAVPLDHAGNEADERTCRPADLETAAADKGYDQTPSDRCVEATLRRDA
jgi:hypothetical protein